MTPINSFCGRVIAVMATLAKGTGNRVMIHLSAAKTDRTLVAIRTLRRGWNRYVFCRNRSHARELVFVAGRAKRRDNRVVHGRQGERRRAFLVAVVAGRRGRDVDCRLGRSRRSMATLTAAWGIRRMHERGTCERRRRLMAGRAFLTCLNCGMARQRQ